MTCCVATQDKGRVCKQQARQVPRPRAVARLVQALTPATGGADAIARGVWILLITLTMNVPATADVPAPDEFNRLPPEDRLEVILAALQGREADLNVFTYEVSEEVIGVPRGSGTRNLLTKSYYALKRKGQRNLLHCRRFDEHSGAITSEFWSSWDGRRQVSLVHEPGKTQVVAIRDREVQFVRGFFFHLMFGFRVPNTDRTLSEWIQELTQTKVSPTDVRLVVEDGRTLFHVKLKSSIDGRHEFWIDPAQGYMPVKHTYDLANGSSTSLEEVKASRKIDGVWIPTAIVKRLANVSMSSFNDIYWSVKTFSRAEVSEDDLLVRYSAGTRVVNEVDKTAHLVLADGSLQQLSYYDPVAGKVHNPEAQQIAVADYGAAAPVFGRLRMMLTAGTLLAGAGIAAGLWLLARRRRLHGAG